ncbi:MAG: hypothetical protein HY707_12415 [Ignavibacteriae bacterium]|nr:hypothetical protein [Ignavibacteriota bacterium]
MRKQDKHRNGSQERYVQTGRRWLSETEAGTVAAVSCTQVKSRHRNLEHPCSPVALYRRSRVGENSKGCLCEALRPTERLTAMTEHRQRVHDLFLQSLR